MHASHRELNSKFLRAALSSDEKNTLGFIRECFSIHKFADKVSEIEIYSSIVSILKSQ